MKRILLASVAAAALWAAPSFAADPGMPMEEAPIGFSWTGGYVGVQGGYTWGDSHLLFSNSVTSDPDPKGLLGGIYVGYNHQFNNRVVLGIDADVAWSGADGSDVTRLGALVNAAERHTGEINWSGAVRARLGYAVDRFLPYIAGGFAVADYDHTFRNGAIFSRFSETVTGYTIGAGLEYAFTDNLIVRAEYRFSDFGSSNFAATPGLLAHEIDLDTHDVRVGLSYKF